MNFTSSLNTSRIAEQPYYCNGTCMSPMSSRIVEISAVTVALRLAARGFGAEAVTIVTIITIPTIMTIITMITITIITTVHTGVAQVRRTARLATIIRQPPSLHGRYHQFYTPVMYRCTDARIQISTLVGEYLLLGLGLYRHLEVQGRALACNPGCPTLLLHHPAISIQFRQFKFPGSAGKIDASERNCSWAIVFVLCRIIVSIIRHSSLSWRS